MKTLIQNFSRQLEEAIAIGKKAKIEKPKNEIRHVVVSGLGGSGIGANLIAELVADELKVPFVICKDYHLPSFINENTLFIASSYSGNTEETLTCLQTAIQQKAQIALITSGGKALQIAQSKNLNHIIIPSGNPPRACLGYSSVQQLYVLYKSGLISNRFERQLEATIQLLDVEKINIQKEAKSVSKKLFGKIPILYSVAENESIAVRFRQQINENGKMLCWHHVVPEMNHNELVGWRNKSKLWAPLFLRSTTDYERNQKRIEINQTIIKKYAQKPIEIWAKGDSKLARSFYLIHLTDWVSYYLSKLNEVDVTEVKVIDFLKGELAKI